MQGSKRKREGEEENDRPTKQISEGEGDQVPSCGMDFLPTELVAGILAFAVLPHPGSRNRKVDPVTWVICRFVCREWRDILPANVEHAEVFPSEAAVRGSVPLLKWAKANGCTLDENASAMAARGGQLEVMKWLREHGCPWDNYTCIEAAKGGHLELLKWMVENGCSWNSGMINRAAQAGHVEVVKGQ